MNPGDIRTWVGDAVAPIGWREKYSGKTFMLVAEHRRGIHSTWDVLFEGRTSVYSEDMIRTHSMPLRGDSGTW
jgi:hypothetical protein